MSGPRPPPRRTLRDDARAVGAACVAGALRAAARQASRVLDDALAPAGLSGAQFSLMCTVASADDDGIVALARRTGLDASTLSRSLDALARAGWVEIAVVGEDRRRRLAWLTEAGAHRLADAMPRWRAAQAALRRRIDADALRAVARGAAALREPVAAAGRPPAASTTVGARRREER